MKRRIELKNPSIDEVIINLKIIMKQLLSQGFVVCLFIHLLGCSNKVSPNQEERESMITASQEKLLSDGWYFPNEVPTGELPKEYGVKAKYGQQDNYFDIEIGKGCSVAVKIVDAATDQCIRYVVVPENSTVNVQMIPQGKYYLKLAYGKDWMELDNGDESITAKFTDNVSYEMSTDIFDFGKKNSTSIVNYILKINIENNESNNNFNTIKISENTFMK